MTIRYLAGISCTALSPSRYLINSEMVREGFSCSTFITFTGTAWTLEWSFAAGDLHRCSLDFTRPEDVMNYILDISAGRAQA